MENCECIWNKLQKAIETVVNSLINMRDTTSNSINDSGEIMQSPQISSNTNTGNNLMVVAILILSALAVYIRMQQRANRNENREQPEKKDKSKIDKSS